MRKRPKMASLGIMLTLVLITFQPVCRVTGMPQASDELRIYGSVNTPLNLTYAELLSFPAVSEVARLICVWGNPDVTYNWTGIPLFYLLTLAQIKPEAYKVVTRGSDGFSSDLLVEDALKPTTILALGANGTELPTLGGIQGLYRLVVPQNWGYKWVGDVAEIEVVTSDYLGTYESSGIGSDNGTIPGSEPPPPQTPSLQTFDLTYGNRTFEVGVFTNASITAPASDYSQNTINVNITVQHGASGFADFILDRDFLRGPYNFTLDDKTVGVVEADTNKSSYVYMVLDEGFHTASISGTAFFGNIPEIIVNYNKMTYVGQNVTLDASKSVNYGTIVSYEWSFGDGLTGAGAIVSHSYDREGTFQVKLNVTDNYGIGNSETFTITVVSPPQIISLAIKVFLAAILGSLILMLAVLLKKRRKNTSSKSGDSSSNISARNSSQHVHEHHQA